MEYTRRTSSDDEQRQIEIDVARLPRRVVAQSQTELIDIRDVLVERVAVGEGTTERNETLRQGVVARGVSSSERARP